MVVTLFAFIFVGIAAFSVPGTFGSVVNSLFPIGKFVLWLRDSLGGGGGITKAKEADV